MDKREKIEMAIELLNSIKQFAQEGSCLLHGVLGEMDAARDFALLNRAKFRIEEGGLSDTKRTRGRPKKQK